MNLRSTTIWAAAAVGIAGGSFWAAWGSSRDPVVESLQQAPATSPVLPPSAPLRQAAELSDAFTQIAQAVTPAVVRIEAERVIERPEPDFVPRWLRDGRGPQDSLGWGTVPELGGGTGIVISPDGHVLTNHHVVAGASRLTVSLSDKRTFPAEIVGLDPSTDLAVIRIDARSLPVARLGDSDDSRVGEWVLAVGNPGFGSEEMLDFTVTSGIISAKGRPLGVIERNLAAGDPAVDYTIEDFIQTDAVINPGNSGGPLVNLSGFVIGITTAIATTTGFSQGYGFAIPSNLARRVASDLITHGRVRRPLLGVSIADVAAEDTEVYGLPSIAGILVSDFGPGSPAQAAGLRRHDVIVAVDGRTVERVGQLQRVIAQHDPGDTVRLAVIRYGDSLEFTVRLAEARLEVQPAAQAEPPSLELFGDLGLRFSDLDAQTARRLGYHRAGGALVADVSPLSPADRKRIVVGMRLVAVDGRSVDGAREARAAIRSAPRGRVVSLVLEDPGGRTYIRNVRRP